MQSDLLIFCLHKIKHEINANAINLSWHMQRIGTFRFVHDDDHQHEWKALNELSFIKKNEPNDFQTNLKCYLMIYYYYRLANANK